MFKNYLTHSFIVSFHQLCRGLELQASAPTLQSFHRVLRSSEHLMVSFEKFLRASDDVQRGVCIYSALTNFRECREELVEMNQWSGDLEIKGAIVSARLEQLALEVCRSEMGQLRMLG